MTRPAVFAAVLWAALLGGACSTAPASTSDGGAESALEERVEGGARVGDLLAPDAPTAVLVYPARFAFTCSAELALWQDLARSGHVHLVVLLTREPTAADRRALALRRIQVAGVLADEAQGPGGPREYLVEGGVVRLSAAGTKAAGANSGILAEVVRRAKSAPPPRHAAP